MSVETANRLTFRAPFDGDRLLAYLERRAVPGIEQVRDGAYTRSLALPHGAGTVRLALVEDHVDARFVVDDQRDLDVAARHCRALLDLDADPHPVSDVLTADPLIGPLRQAAPGLRVPGTVDGPELAVRAVLGQQISLSAAATAAGRLVAGLGTPLTRPLGTVTHVFPTPAALAEADPSTLRMPASRARALIGLAGHLAADDLDLSPAADRDETRRRLLELPGIGPWTAAYIAMRALRDPDAFPASDLGVRRALENHDLDGRPTAAEHRARRWRPYRAYATMHLWVDLADRGRISART